MKTQLYKIYLYIILALLSFQPLGILQGYITVINNGDVFLGLQKNGSPNYVIDLGSYSTFATDTNTILTNTSFGISTSSLNSDLTAAFGSNWYNNSVFMGLPPFNLLIFPRLYQNLVPPPGLQLLIIV